MEHSSDIDTTVPSTSSQPPFPELAAEFDIDGDEGERDNAVPHDSVSVRSDAREWACFELRPHHDGGGSLAAWESKTTKEKLETILRLYTSDFRTSSEMRLEPLGREMGDTLEINVNDTSTQATDSLVNFTSKLSFRVLDVRSRCRVGDAQPIFLKDPLLMCARVISHPARKHLAFETDETPTTRPCAQSFTDEISFKSRERDHQEGPVLSVPALGHINVIRLQTRRDSLINLDELHDIKAAFESNKFPTDLGELQEVYFRLPEELATESVGHTTSAPSYLDAIKIVIDIFVNAMNPQEAESGLAELHANEPHLDKRIRTSQNPDSRSSVLKWVEKQAELYKEELGVQEADSTVEMENQEDQVERDAETPIQTLGYPDFYIETYGESMELGEEEPAFHAQLRKDLEAYLKRYPGAEFGDLTKQGPEPWESTCRSKVSVHADSPHNQIEQ